MAAPNEKLAESLQLLHAAQSDGILRATALSRTHRERLIKAGFLQEVIRGWFIVTSPAYADGSSTAWYASFWTFTARYLADRFSTDYCLSPEASIKRHVRSEIIPQQVIVMTTGASNQLLNLCFDTSLMIYQEKANFPAERVQQDGLRLMDLPAALCRVRE